MIWLFHKADMISIQHIYIRAHLAHIQGGLTKVIDRWTLKNIVLADENSFLFYQLVNIFACMKSLAYYAMSMHTHSTGIINPSALKTNHH